MCACVCMCARARVCASIIVHMCVYACVCMCAYVWVYVLGTILISTVHLNNEEKNFQQTQNFVLSPVPFLLDSKSVWMWQREVWVARGAPPPPVVTSPANSASEVFDISNFDAERFCVECTSAHTWYVYCLSCKIFLHHVTAPPLPPAVGIRGQLYYFLTHFVANA